MEQKTACGCYIEKRTELFEKLKRKIDVEELMNEFFCLSPEERAHYNSLAIQHNESLPRAKIPGEIIASEGSTACAESVQSTGCLFLN